MQDIAEPWLNKGGKQQEIEKLTGMVLPETDPRNVITTSSGDEILSDIIAVTFKEGVRSEVKEAVAKSVNGVIGGEIPQINVNYLKFALPRTEIEIKDIIEQLERDPAVESASPEYLITLNSIFPETTDIEHLSYDKKWGFERIMMPDAWQAIREAGIDLSDEVVVAVIDTGFDLNHPDLKENFITSLPGGYVSIDFGDEDTDVSIDGIFNTHGTLVSGIIAATINGEGINGVAPTAKIFPIKYAGSKWCAFWSSKGKPSNCKKTSPIPAAAGVVYAANAGVDIINLSSGWSSGIPLLADFTFDCDSNKAMGKRDLTKAIRYAYQRGVVIIASAGNAGQNAAGHWPACLEEVIAVGATDKSDNRAAEAKWSSNYPDNENNEAALTVAAPGVDIYTTQPRSSAIYEFRFGSPYRKADGTSVAAPFVSGLAALMKQIDPSLSPKEVQRILRDAADEVQVNTPIGPQKWKRINAYKVVKKLLRTDVARLSISIDPNPVPFNTSPQRTLGWNFKMTLQETRGIGVRLTGLLDRYFDVNGELVASIESPESFFLRLFGTTYIPPGGRIEASLWQSPWSEVDLASNKKVIYGKDDNGNEIEATITINFQQNVTRGLKIEFDPSPALFDGQNWQSVMIITEISGIGVELTGVSFGYYDGQGVALPPSVVKDQAFLSGIFDTARVAAGSEIAGLITIPYKPEAHSMAWSIVGIDDNGHSVYGAVGLPLEQPGSITISSRSLAQPLLLLPQAAGLTQ